MTSAISELLLPIVLGGLALTVLIGFLAFIRNWKRVAPEKAAIIYGRTFKVRDEKGGIVRERGFRIVKGGATLVWPILEKISWLDLNVVQLPVVVENSYSRDGVAVSVEAMANVKIDGTDASLEIAAEQFGGMGEQEIHSTIRETLQGHLRAILGKLTPEEIYRDRQKFGQEVQDAAEPDLKAMGFTIVTFPIKDVRDPQGYLDSLGKKRTAEVKRDAAVGEAEAERERMEKTSEALRRGKEAAFENEQKVAEAERQLNVRKAQLKAEVDAEQSKADQAGPLSKARAEKEVRLAEVERETAETNARIGLQMKEQERRRAELDATLITQAQAEKQQRIISAEADREAASLKAEAIRVTAEAQKQKDSLEGEGQAAAIRALREADAAGHKASLLASAEGEKASLLAKAEGQKAQLLAEAEGKEKLAVALAKLDQTGRLLQVLDAAPEVARAIGDAVAKALGDEGAARIFAAAAAPLASVDEIRIVDLGGGGNGRDPVTRYAGTVPRFVFDFINQADAVGLGHLLKRFGLTSELLDPIVQAVKQEETKAGPAAARKQRSDATPEAD
jgi:flotillin